MNMERPHILFLIDVLASTAGGAEGILWKITRRLPRERFRCSIATFSPDPGVVPVDRFDCPVHLFPIRRTYDWQALRAAMKLRRLIRSERYSIVHTFFPASDVLGGVVARLSGDAILISSRRDMGLLRTASHRVAYRVLGGIFHQVHAVAEEVRRFHIEPDGLDPNRVVTLHNGVDLDEIDSVGAGPWPPELGFGDGTPVVVCVANVRPVKAIDVLVRTAALVCREAPGARFLVVGAVQDSAYCAHVIELARNLKVADKVIFAGARDDVVRILKASRVFYLPSRSEGLSNAALEAMASSLPCVCTDVGGNGELVEDGVNGYLIPSEDPAAARDRLVWLLRDSGLCRRMGTAGRRIVEARFSLDTMMTRLTGLYEGLLAARGNSQAEARLPGLCREIDQ